jgi:hypothetical protein
VSGLGSNNWSSVGRALGSELAPTGEDFGRRTEGAGSGRGRRTRRLRVWCAGSQAGTRALLRASSGGRAMNSANEAGEIRRLRPMLMLTIL